METSNIVSKPSPKGSQGHGECPNLGAKPKNANVNKSATHVNGMHSELTRLTTFISWPQSAQAYPTELAENGFYYRPGMGDEVTCFSCNHSLKDWLWEHSVRARHLDASSNSCPYLLGLDSSNILFGPSNDECSTTSSADLAGPEAVRTSSHSINGVENGHHLVNGATNIPPTLLQSDVVPEVMTREVDNRQSSSPKITTHEQSAVSPGNEQHTSHGGEEWEEDDATEDGTSNISHVRSVTASNIASAFAALNSMTQTASNVRQGTTSSNLPAPNVQGSDNVRSSSHRDAQLSNNGASRSSSNHNEQQNEQQDTQLSISGSSRSQNCSQNASAGAGQLNTSTLSGAHYNLMVNITQAFDRQQFPSMQEPQTQRDAVLQQILPPNEGQRHSISGFDIQELLSNPEMQNHLKREKVRLVTFSSWPDTFPRLSTQMARAGFYFIGPRDRVRCAFCTNVLRMWEEGDNPDEEHHKFFPSCPFVIDRNACGNIRLEDDNEPLPVLGTDSSTENLQSDRLGIILERPRHPEFRLPPQRMNTYVTWPWPDSASIMPEPLADAGFFYTGQGDLTRCWYCDMGLRLWKADDDPWQEHARWFPKCGFVRMVKGQDYINSVQDRYGHQDAADRSSNNVYIDPLVDRRKLHGMMESPVTQQVIDIGFAPAVVSRVLEDHIKQSGAAITTIDELLDKVLSAGENNDNQENSLARANTPPASDEKDEPSILCQVCMDRERNIVFLPCGHLTCCSNCAPSLQSCPICRKQIRGTVRVYMG